MVNFSKSILAVALATTLAACGGGGDSASTPSSGGNSTPPTSGNGNTTPTLSMSLSETSVQLDELSSTEISVTIDYTGSGTLSYSLEASPASSSAYAEVSASGETITISAADMEQDVTYSIDVTLTDGTVSDSATLNLSIDNTSGEVVLAEANSWSDGDTVFSYSELDKLADFYGQAAYLSGAVNFTEKALLLESYQQVVDSSNESSTDAIFSDFLDDLSSFSSGTIPESQLVESLNKVKQLANTQNTLVVDKFNEIAALLNGELPQLAEGDYQYVEQYGVFSSVIGNDAMGSFDGDTWTFSSSYDVLNAKVLNTETCEAN